MNYINILVISSAVMSTVISIICMVSAIAYCFRNSAFKRAYEKVVLVMMLPSKRKRHMQIVKLNLQEQREKELREEKIRKIKQVEKIISEVAYQKAA